MTAARGSRAVERTFSAKSVRERTVMSAVADLGVDERRARVALSLLAEPDDPVTGGLLRHLGAVEKLGLLDPDTTVPGLARVDGQVWRDRLTSPGRTVGRDQRLRMVEASGIATLIPGDVHWPRALHDLGERAPYVLFMRGATSFLARPMQDLVTVTGSRAASGVWGACRRRAGCRPREQGTRAGSWWRLRCRIRGAPRDVGSRWRHDRGARRRRGPPLPEREPGLTGPGG